MKRIERIINPQTEDPTTYHTRDLNLVAFLLVKGFKFSQTPDTPDTESDLVRFYFSRSKELSNTLDDYRNYRSSVDARSLFEKLRSIRALAFAVRKGMYEDPIKQNGENQNGEEKEK